MNFLRQIAEQYVNNEFDNLSDCCFVLPNKRSGIFLRKHFSDILKENGQTAIMPQITTISNFVSEFNDDVEASSSELLLILYRIYAEVLSERVTPDENPAELIDINRFLFWGDILLNDFNDVDKYAVDPAEIFKNIKDLKEISSNFLTPEQLEIIRRYWEIEIGPESVKEFWRHAVHTFPAEEGESHGDKASVAGFVKLWQAMFEIYTRFRAKLDELGLTYSGKAYRDAMEAIERLDSGDELHYKRYIFVGFNTLSTSEYKIFDSLRKLNVADFYWDYSSAALEVENNRASHFIRGYVQDFPSRYKLPEKEEQLEFPEINVIAFPSTAGQVKAIEPLLRNLHPRLFTPKPEDDAPEELKQKYNEILDEERAKLINTSIVLPEETLASAVLNAVPSVVRDINVTMGFPLRLTQVASLLKSIISLQLRARTLRQQYSFYYEDVIEVLSHPLVRKASALTADKIVRLINEKRLFNISGDMLAGDEYKDLSPIFRIVENVNDPDAVIGYFDDLFAWLLKIVEESQRGVVDPVALEEADKNLEKDEMPASSLEVGIIRSYQEAMAELKALKSTYLKDIFLEDRTMFHLVERIAGSRSAAFKGMPLKGLQVMGVLETRALDFDNVIIMSMNERIFPRKHIAKSFIPNAIRRGNKMSTIEMQESVASYYFYRMLTRSRHVYLFYDSRTTGLRSGDASRFITQLKYIAPKEKIRFYGTALPLSSTSEVRLSAEKTPEVIARLNQYLPGAESPRYLSASALSNYISCPLKFYLNNVEQLYEESEIKNYMDEGTYGTIIHEVVEQIYTQAKGERPELPVTAEMLDGFASDAVINRPLSEAIRKHYLKSEDVSSPLYGDAEIFFGIMKKSIKNMFRREKALLPFSFVSGEENKNVELKIDPTHAINFNYRIDRVDRVYSDDNDSYYRLIDYKTGSDALTATGVDVLLRPQRTHPKAIMQLMLYANAFAQKENYEGKITPLIYKFRSMAKEDIGLIKIKKEQLDDYRDINDEFLTELAKIIDEIFDPSKSFDAKPDPDHCKYCQFKELCGL